MRRLLATLALALVIAAPCFALCPEKRKLSSTSYPVQFYLVSSTDHVTAVTSASVTCTRRKAGGGVTFNACSGAVSEIASGLYEIAGNATDRDTLGPLDFLLTATGADPAPVCVMIASYDDTDPSTWTVGTTSTATTATTCGSVTGNVGGSVASVTGNVGGNVVGSVASVTARATCNTDQWAGTTIPAPNVTGVPKVDLLDVAGAAVNTSSPQLGVNVVTNGDKTGYALSSGGVTAVQAGLATSAYQITSVSPGCLQDYDPSTIIHCFFTTKTTLLGTPSVGVYKATSPAGSQPLLEVGSAVVLEADYNNAQGLNHVIVDTTQDPSFFQSGKFYQIIVIQGTVAGTQMANVTVGAFTLKDTSALRPATPGQTIALDVNGRTDVSKVLGTSQTAFDLGAGISAVKLKTDQLTFTTTNRVDSSALNQVDILQSAADKAWLSASRTLTLFPSSPTAGEIAIAVWDEQLGNHTSAGTTGLQLNDISTADVWDELTASHLAANTFGAFVQASSPPSADTIANTIWSSTSYGPSSWVVAGSAGYYIASRLNLITAGGITIASPVVNVHDLSIVPGTAYMTAPHGRAITFGPIDGTVPADDLTGATPALTILDDTAVVLTVTGVVTGAGSASQYITFQLTATNTALLTRINPEAYSLQVNVTYSADTPPQPIRLFDGKVTTRARYQ